MPVVVELTPDRLKMLITVLREGKPPFRDRFDPVAAKQRRKQADAWAVEGDLFDAWCEETRAHGGARTFTVPEPVPLGADTFFVRKMAETREKAAVHKSEPARFVKDTLPGISTDCVAEWVGAEGLCCLDIDYHDHAPPSREWLDTIVRTRVAPTPLAWHFSKSGGLHLFYVSAGVFSADELAACAALRFRSIDSSAGVELKTVVRGPGGEPVQHYKHQDTGAGLVDWLGSPEYDESTRDAWLDSEGMECGKRYEHDRCPIDPGPGAERLPVLVSEAGVYCFRCNGKGHTFGSRRPGWAPWSAILGAPSSGELGSLVRNVAHWGHAKWVLTERYGFPEPLARLAYAAALKAYHEGKPTESQLSKVFIKQSENLARVNNLWMTIEKAFTYKDQIQPILRTLPQCIYENAAGEQKVCEATVCELNQTKDQSARGYKNINVVHGFKLASVFLGDYYRNTTVAVVNPDLKEYTTRGLPKYVIPSKRMPIEDAWQLVETVLPKIDRVYITGLLVAFGCAQETRRGLLPIVFASGPSAAGKTAMAQVAAGIAGARVGAEATYHPEQDKFRAGIYEGGQQGPVVVFNELLKDSTRGRNKITVREALDFVLNLTANSTSNMNYKGPVKMGRLPSLVITDTVVPEGIHEQRQLARRVRHHPVRGLKEEWKNTIAAAGVTDLHLLRTASDAVACACDAIMSDTIDTYFALPSTWDEMADQIGIKTLEHSDQFLDRTPWMRELFRLTCEAPELTGRESKLYADGYKKITRGAGGPGDDEDNLTCVYSQFADGPGSDWGQSRRLMERDWSSILRVDDPVELDLRAASGCVYLRFRMGPAKKPIKTNAQIVDPKEWSRML